MQKSNIEITNDYRKCYENVKNGFQPPFLKRKKECLVWPPFPKSLAIVASFAKLVFIHFKNFFKNRIRR